MRHDNKHLHIAEQDPIPDWLVKSMKAAQTGTIKLDMEGQPAVKIDIINYGNKIVVDFLQPVFFRTTDDETGLFDKLKTAREFAKKLTDNDITISFLRRGKEAITLGKDAKPRLSKKKRSCYGQHVYKRHSHFRFCDMASWSV